MSSISPTHNYEADDYITSRARLTVSPAKLFDNACSREIVNFLGGHTRQ
jgi:hypothetical protein